MSSTGITKKPLHVLRTQFSGVVIEPGDPGWQAAAQAYNLAIVQQPTIIAVPAHEQDVVAVVEFAREQGMQIAPQRTGHNAEPLGALDGVILVKTDALDGVEIDVERCIARVQAGAKWRDLVPRASELGLAALHGSSPDVSIAGYSLGGGVGWYARKLGLSTNSVTAIELVTADGRLRRVDHDHDADLFWALRGGGGNFGVVTALELRLYPISEVYAGMLFFPWERSAEVLQAWRGWTQSVPDEVMSVGRIIQFPPLPAVPEPVRGKSFALAEAVVIGDEAFGSALLRPLRELSPVMDTFAVVPPAGIAELNMDPPDPVPYVGNGMMLDDLPAAAVDEFVAVAGPGSDSPLLSAEIRHLGGALGRSGPQHGALATLDASYLTFAAGMVFDEESRRAALRQIERLEHALAPYDTGREYFNFAERKTDPARFFTPDTYRRLRAVKAEIDPKNIFRANHSIPGAPADEYAEAA